MNLHLTATIASLLAISAAATAQNCSDNSHTIRLVDSTGTLVPTSGSGSGLTYHPASEQVYLALPASLPSGIYYVHVTDEIGGHDEVLSMNQPADRFVEVTNNAGVITLALPYSINPDLPPFGAGLNGVGDSLPLFPFFSASWDPCRFKAWLGDSWGEPINPANPYLLAGGFDAANNRCRIRSYVPFTIGDGTGSDVTGKVFEDGDRDGLQGGGEAGIGGEPVRLVGAGGTLTTLTEADGSFRFVDVPVGSYSVEITVSTGSTATTPTSHTIEVCGCADVAVEAFGRAADVCLPTDGHTIGYWRNRHGLGLICRHNLLPQINGLGLVNSCGRHVTFGDLSGYACWLRSANSWNMAYMLGAQMTAMYLNVAVGFVDANALIDDPELGVISIGDLLAQAAASIAAHPYTPPCSPHRDFQENLKDALDDANNNLNWVNPCDSGCSDGGSCGPTGGSCDGDRDDDGGDRCGGKKKYRTRRDHRRCR
ncbi:MAG: SdrD B-like domain-containing protein [Planctomycetota bacterium]